MKLAAYWTESAPAFRPAARELPAQVDVAVVGGGFTGLSAALALARRGASVVVLEAGERVAAEASGRNGGHVNNGLAVDYAEVAAKVGRERARDWYHAYDDAVDTVARLVHDEAIECDFSRTGKLKLATRPRAVCSRCVWPLPTRSSRCTQVPVWICAPRRSAAAARPCAKRPMCIWPLRL